MKDLPFNVSMLVFALYLGVIIAGGMLGTIFKNFRFDGFWGIYLAAVFALPVGNAIRYGLGKFFADQSGYEGPHPTAFNFPIRMAIGAGVAIPVAFLFNSLINTTALFEFGGLIGALAAFVTTMVIAGIFYARYSLKG
ncbi:MAG: hypothetical protein AAGF25_09140 [Pseudomonadota bacterium]